MRVFMFNIIICLLLIAGCGGENQPPDVPSEPYPANREVNVPVDITLSWRCSDPDGDHITYDVYVQDELEEVSFVVEDHSLSLWSIKGLKYDTNYRWRVIARDEKGNVTEGPIWTFTTGKYSPPIQVEKVLINETVKVDPGKYAYWKFSLAKGSKLHGEIASDSAINVWLMSKGEYEAFERWEAFSPYAEASRKQILQFTFDHTVPETAEYYLVLDNRSSLFTPKAVSVYIKVTE